jgi:hypothetical protein
LEVSVNNICRPVPALLLPMLTIVGPQGTGMGGPDDCSAAHKRALDMDVNTPDSLDAHTGCQERQSQQLPDLYHVNTPHQYDTTHSLRRQHDQQCRPEQEQVYNSITPQGGTHLPRAGPIARMYEQYLSGGIDKSTTQAEFWKSMLDRCDMTGPAKKTGQLWDFEQFTVLAEEALYQTARDLALYRLQPPVSGGFEPRHETVNKDPTNTTVFVGNVKPHLSEGLLDKLFSPYGLIGRVSPLLLVGYLFVGLSSFRSRYCLAGTVPLFRSSKKRVLSMPSTVCKGSMYSGIKSVQLGGVLRVSSLLRQYPIGLT